jgi:hypothetical protein
MRRRPWSLVILAFLHLIAPVGNIALNAALAGRPLIDYFSYAFSWVYIEKNWPMILAPMIAGVAIYACKKWSFYVYLLAITALFVFSYIGFLSKEGAIGFFPLLLVYLVNIAVVVFFLIPAVRNIYFDRRMRWWEIKPRYHCDFKAEWQFEDDTVTHPGEIGNISLNGLFLKSEIYPRDEDVVTIQIPFDGREPVQLKGRVVFHRNTEKLGFGVQFEHNQQSKQEATAMVQALEDKGQRVNSLEIRPEDSLTFWLRTLLTTGKGLIPKVNKPKAH